MRKSIVVFAVLAVVLSAIPVLEDASADTDDGDAYCFYGDHPRFYYEYTKSDGVTIGWEVRNEIGDTLGFEYLNEGDDTAIEVDLTGEPYLSRVAVTQTVLQNGTIVDSKTLYAIPLHIGGSTYEVTFMDGGNVLNVQRIDRTTMVKEGQPHVILPPAPEKEGYVFGGWYEDQSFMQEFDPTEPVRGSMTIHAKWIGTGSGSTTEIVYVGGAYTVTFQIETGLELDIIDRSSSTVSFTVGVVGGYELEEGTLTVESDGGSISESNGVYSLSGIDRDIHVSIEGDVHELSSDPGTDGGSEFPWLYIVIAVIAIAVVAVAFLVYRSRSRRD